jgi:hypothetical protein
MLWAFLLGAFTSFTVGSPFPDFLTHFDPPPSDTLGWEFFDPEIAATSSPEASLGSDPLLSLAPYSEDSTDLFTFRHMDILDGWDQGSNLDYVSGTGGDAEILDIEFALLDEDGGDGWESFVASDPFNAELAGSGSSCAAEVSQSYGKGKRFVCPVPESGTSGDTSEDTSEGTPAEIPELPDISALEVMLKDQEPTNKPEKPQTLPGDIPFTPGENDKLCKDGYVALCCKEQDPQGLTQIGCSECKLSLFPVL